MTMPLPYGARCTWWDSMVAAGRLQIPKSTGTVNGRQVEIGDTSLPCCPHCKGVLFQVESEDAWWKGVERYARETGDADYPNFIRWLRGKCFRDPAKARELYALEKAATEGGSNG